MGRRLLSWWYKSSIPMWSSFASNLPDVSTSHICE